MPSQMQVTDAEVLVLNGSPGSGKTTLANAIAEQLRQMDVPHAVIDVDELGRVHPEIDSAICWRNLSAIWPNYSAFPNLKAILPVCIDRRHDWEALRSAVSAKRFTICELVAGESVLKQRVTSREPNEYWQSKLRKLVDRHLGKHAADKFGDFRVRTDDKSIDETAREILQRLNWRSTPRASASDATRSPG